jgi:hypothetical protein
MRGPYHLHNPDLPIYGMGAPELPQVGFGDEILREMLGGQPLGVYVSWAEQVSDVTWREIPAPEWSLTCVPITQSMLDQVKGAAFGHEVGWVGVLFDQPATINAIERALHGTPYAFDSSLAVYDPNFQGTVPRIRFLVWARLRDAMPGDGAGGGSGSMDAAARALNGRLVYVIQGAVPPTVKVPRTSFQQALEAQLAPPAPVLRTAPALSATQPTPTALPDAATSATKDNTLLWVLLGGGAAALALWWYAKSKDVKPASRQLPARGETGTY